MKIAKEQFKKLEDAFKKLSKFAEDTATKFVDAKTKDGQALQIEGDTIAPGAKVMVVGQDGTPAPAPDGELTLEDGTIITCKGGLITEITPPGDGGDKPGENMQKEIETLRAENKSLSDRLAAMEGKFKTIETEMSAQKKKVEGVEEVAKETFSVVEKLVNIPEEKPTQKQVFKAGSKDDRYKNLAEAIKKSKLKQ